MPNELNALKNIQGNNFGQLTKQSMSTLNEMSHKPITVAKAYAELSQDIRPFGERLIEYACERFSILEYGEDIPIGRAETPALVEKRIQQAAKEGGIRSVARSVDRNGKRGMVEGFPPKTLRSWLSYRRDVCPIQDRVDVFKLCLVFKLGVEDSAVFLHDVLYIDWFNYRSIEDWIYLYFLNHQDAFGKRSFSEAIAMIEEMSKLAEIEVTSSRKIHSKADVCRFIGDIQRTTCLLQDKLWEFSLRQTDTTRGVKDFLRSNIKSFTAIRRSAYDQYLYHLGTDPDLAKYAEETDFKTLKYLYTKRFNKGAVLPTNLYLDMSAAENYRDRKAKRLIGSRVIEAREAWWQAHKEQPKDRKATAQTELLDKRFVVTKELKKIKQTGVLRGNMLFVLFYRFSLEHCYNDILNDQNKRQPKLPKEGLFDKFYKEANRILVDECGMMPLHPRNPRDRMFLLSVAAAEAGDEDRKPIDPIDYLDDLLCDHYRSLQQEQQ
ncbi:MAG: hypothetical protein PUD81_01710 [Eggerthellales bacterium]|nr:hypothetical protein [Eggerthellales bacterium]